MPDPASENTRLSFGWPDWVIIAAYLLMLLAIGWYHSRRQKTIKEYFLAGKHMSWLPLGLSLMAALNSGIDYLTQPSAFLKFGIVIILGSLSWLVIYPYAFLVTMPMYRRLDVYSAYEYLDNRFNVAVRCLASASSSSGGSAGWRRRCTFRAWRSTPPPAEACRSSRRSSSWARWPRCTPCWAE